MHLFNLACIAAIFIITFCFVSADFSPDFYRQMRDKAKNCVEGTAIEISDRCYGCICVMTGVIKCDPSQCAIGQQANEEGEDDGNGDALQSEDPEPAVEEEVPEPEPAAQADEPDDKSSLYKQLRDDATGCTPGEKISRCNGVLNCICVLPGVVRCRGLACGPIDE